MLLLDLPTDVLSQILVECRLEERITEVCCEFAAIAYSIPLLWRGIHIGPRQLVPDGPGFLRSRIGRAGIQPLTVSISDIVKVNASTEVIDQIYRVLTEHNTQIKRVQIDAQTAFEAGNILSFLYPSLSTTFLELTNLSIRVEEDPGRYTAIWPQLDLFLQLAMPSFPNLRALSIPTHFSCIPVFKSGTELLRNLHTLIFDGSIEEEEPSMALIIGLLHYTPQLEVLWLKTLTRETSVTLASSMIPRTRKNSEGVPIPVSLPRLTHLAVTAPGAGSDLLQCVQAPELRRIHLDGSREPLDQEDIGQDVSWSHNDAAEVLSRMKMLARGSPDLQDLALTGTSFSKEGWRWLFLGGEPERAPFPQLETLSLRDINSVSGLPELEFSDELFAQYLLRTDLSLRRLSLRRCMFSVNGTALLSRFNDATKRNPSSSCKLELDSFCTGVTAHHLRILEESGATVVNHGEEEVEGREWWSQRHEIDALDSNIYCNTNSVVYEV